MILTEEMIKNLPIIDEEGCYDGEAIAEEIISQYNKLVEEYDKQLWEELE